MSIDVIIMPFAFYLFFLFDWEGGGGEGHQVVTWFDVRVTDTLICEGSKWAIKKGHSTPPVTRFQTAEMGGMHVSVEKVDEGFLSNGKRNWLTDP